VGILTDPGSKTVVVLCHGFASNKNSNTSKRLEKEMNNKGYATFRFDFYGHGESEGEFGNITLTEAVNDTIQAVELVRGKGYEKIGLVGSSFGGMAAWLAAAKVKDLFVLALRCPVSDYLGKLVAQRDVKKWKEQGYLDYKCHDGIKKLAYAFFEDTEKYTGHKEATKITAPTIIIHGDADESVPVEQSKKLSEVIKHCTLHILPGADHRFSKDFEKMIKLLVDFISRHA